VSCLPEIKRASDADRATLDGLHARFLRAVGQPGFTFDRDYRALKAEARAAGVYDRFIKRIYEGALAAEGETVL
jgi:hypothetical protein